MNIVYNTDCMEGLRSMADKSFELAIVDPPYSDLCNLHGGSSSDASHGWGKNWLGNKRFEWNKSPTKEYFNELFRISKNQIIWGGNYFIENLKSTSCLIVWNKGQRDFSLADAEIAWASFEKPVRIFDYSRAESNKQERFHPTQKPIALYEWLLKNYAKAGDKILDTHVGSGSSRIACYKHGYDFTGYELDADYHAAQEKRFTDFVRQEKLFPAKESPTFEQMKIT